MIPSAASRTTAPTKTASVGRSRIRPNKIAARIASVAYISNVSPDPIDTRLPRNRQSSATMRRAWTFRRRDERSSRADRGGPQSSPACMGRVSANYSTRKACRDSTLGVVVAWPWVAKPPMGTELLLAWFGSDRLGLQLGRYSDQRFLDIMGQL